MTKRRKSIVDEFKDIQQDIKNKVFYPVYLFQGDESFFIDKLIELLEENVLNEAEKEFNLNVVYGREIDVSQLVSLAKRYPMMANHHVVIVKEAQNLQKIEQLESYIKNPLKSTLLILEYKYKTLDGRKTISKTINEKGVVFTSQKLYDNQIPDWITNYLSSREYSITPKASLMIAEFVGNDLSKIVNELDKLLINLEKGLEITDQHVENNIGISKDYNMFEFQNALGKRDAPRAYKIADYFGKNIRNFPMMLITSSLYYYFTKLMLVHKSKSKDAKEIGYIIGLHPFIAKEYIRGSSNYSFGKLASIIHHLKTYDLRSKGIDNASTDQAELLRELVFKILN